MKKSLTFVGLGVVLMALLTFMLRLIDVKFFQDNISIAVTIAALSLIFVVIGLIKSKWKSAMWFGLGGFATAAANFLIRLTGFEDNLTLFIVFLVVGLVVLVWGVVKKK